MRVVITLDPRNPFRDEVRGHAEFWLGNHARSTWSMREEEDIDGNEVLEFESGDPLDAMDFHHRAAPAEHRGRIL